MFNASVHITVLLLSAVVGAAGLGQTAIAQTPDSPNPVDTVDSLDLRFADPGDPLPAHDVAGETRGALRFMPPVTDAPSSRVGGGSRGTVQFMPRVVDAPSSRVGGGSRGMLQFRPPIVDAPTGRVGGGTRSLLEFDAPQVTATELATTTGGVRGLLEFSAQETIAKSSLHVDGRNQADPPLTALLPELKIGRTVSARPTFYVYVPPTASQQVFFSIQTGDRQQHYQTVLPVTGTGGVIKFTLPEDAPELAVGQEYQWFFALIEPNGILRPDNYGVQGWVKRVEHLPVAIANPLAQAAEYAEAGIWYDTLDVLATSQSRDPQNPLWQTEWRDLLAQVGLTAIANEPIAQ